VATPDAGPDGFGPQLEVGIRARPADPRHGVSHGEAAWRGAEASAGWSVPGSSADEARPEEVAVCELCGLVSRRPVPVVCPACGGGYG
jgi:hypothetical protein